MSKKTYYLRYTLVGLWMLAIFIFSHQPAGSSDKQSGFIVALLEPVAPVADIDVLTFLTRKAAHFILYFIFGILVYNAVHPNVRSRKKAALVSIAAVLGFAALDEIHQLFVPGRSGEVRDVLLDTTAGAIGIGAYLSLQRLFTGRAKLTKKSK